MVSSPIVIILSDEDRAVLAARARSVRCPYRDVVRARIILAAADATPNTTIATSLDLHVDTVSKWRSRFAANGVAGLKDLARSGRPRTFTAVQVASVKALACTPPADSAVPLVVGRVGHRGSHPSHGGLDQPRQCAPLPRPGRHQTLAAPVLDLPP